jgi:transketolase
MTPVIVALVVVAIGAVAWFLRHRSPGSASVAIDPFVLSEPWRRHVSAAQSAQRRYAEIVSAMPSGPLQANMASITRQVQRGVEECWLIANRGDELDAASNRLDTASLQARLERAVDEPTQSSLQAQLDSANRIKATRDDTDSKLDLLNTRLGELVAQAAEVSVGTDTTAELGSAVDDVVTELESLRLAIQDINQSPGSTGQTSTSP